MTIKTALERLEAIDTAIAAAESAVDVTMGAKRITRERLSTLYAERRRVYQEYLASENSADGGFINKAKF